MPLYPDEIDIEGFLTDLGEPVPGLAAYLLWAVARSSGGDADALLAATGWRGPTGYLSRLSDRVAARYGVSIRFPYQGLAGTEPGLRAELQALADRTLPHASTRSPARVETLAPALAEVAHSLRPELANALLYPRYGERDHAALAGLARIGRAGDGELDRLWRRYVLERWLAMVEPRDRASVPAHRVMPKAVLAGRWQRHLIGTEQLGPHDGIVEKIAWYVAEFANTAQKPVRAALRHPWYLVIAAKPLAVAAGRVRPVWDVEPGRLAAMLAKAAPGTRHPDPWSMQVAVDESGGVRMALAVAAARLGGRAWYDKISGPAAAAVRPPRENACPPGNLAVIAAPPQAGHAAAEILHALRRALPDEMAQALAGCVIVSVGEAGPTPYGWAGAPIAPELLAKLCADNPFGQADERTPLLVATTVTQRKPAKRHQPAKRR